jgi:hypothetical protein
MAYYTEGRHHRKRVPASAANWNWPPGLLTLNPMNVASLQVRMKLVASLCCCVAALALSACTTPVLIAEDDAPPTATATSPAAVVKEYKDYDPLVARAELEIQRAADKGFLWLHTESYLAAAREAHKAGDMEKAMTLAQTALEEALLAQKQAEDGARVKPNFTYRR